MIRRRASTAMLLVLAALAVRQLPADVQPSPPPNAPEAPAPSIAGSDRAKVREFAVTRAERRLAGRRNEARSMHFVVVTDSQDADSAARIAGNLEAAYTVTRGILAGILGPQRDTGRVAVYVYRFKGSLRNLGQELDVAGSYEGFYTGAGLMAFTFETPAVELLLQTMIHETVHVVLHQEAGVEQGRLPLWLDEGFAEYVGCSEMRDGELVLGSHVGYMSYHAHGEVFHEKSVAATHAATVRKAMKKNGAIPVSKLLAAQGEMFHGDQEEMCYSESWLLVHYLNHGEDDSQPKRFPKLVRALMDGAPSEAALRSAYGLDADALEKALRSYAKSF